jgi:hypothetical protein
LFCLSSVGFLMVVSLSGQQDLALSLADRFAIEQGGQKDHEGGVEEEDQPFQSRRGLRLPGKNQSSLETNGSGGAESASAVAALGRS